MTREERLELLKQIEKDIHVCSLDSTFEEDAKSCALHSVIEELEQEPCDDAISRVLNRMWNCRGKNTTNIDKVKMEQIIREELSVQPSRKGHWIKKGNTLKCPFCGAKGEDIKDDYCFNFCPNCGADMRGDTDDSN